MSALLNRSLLAAASRLQEEASALLAWWIHEAQALWYRLLYRIAPARQKRLLVNLRPDKPIVSLLQGDRVETAVELSTSVSEGLPGLLPDPLLQHGGIPATVVLPRTAFLDFDLALPAASERNLSSAIELQLERRLPLSRDQIYAAWKIAEKDARRERIRVAIVVAKKVVIDRIEQEVTLWGSKITSIVAVDSRGIRFELLPRKLKHTRLFQNPTEIRLALIGIGLLAGCIIAFGVQTYREHAAVSQVLGAIHGDAEVAHRLRTSLEKQKTPLIEMQRLMKAPDIADVLSTLTTSIPSETWIYQLDYSIAPDQALKVRVSAYTATAAGFVQHLQKTPQIEDVELLSAVSVGTDPPSDRVEALVSWKSESAP